MLSIIPARSKSKSIPHKNVKELKGKPLMVWSIETSLSLNLRTVVDTDSEEYAKLAREHGAEVIIRPERFARDNSSTYALLAHQLPLLGVEDKETVILLQPTSPFRDPKELKNAIERFRFSEYDSTISVSPVPHDYHPEEVFIERKFGYVMASGLPISMRKKRRQDYSKAAHPNGQFYIFRAGNLKKGSIYGNRVGVYETKKKGVNINEESDWEKAENYE